LLVQLPPDQERDDDRLDYFLRGLPEWMRVAVELRHHSWAVDPVFDLLSRHHATYVVMSGAGLPCVLRATSTTVYVRLHGPDHDHLYAGSYGEADLCWWADRIRVRRRTMRPRMSHIGRPCSLPARCRCHDLSARWPVKS
jgi:uncharacterized protein YecE (DUF72 family)